MSKVEYSSENGTPTLYYYYYSHVHRRWMIPSSRTHYATSSIVKDEFEVTKGDVEKYFLLEELES